MPYNTIADANEYFASRYGFEKWGLLSDPQKTLALNSANQNLDLFFTWEGIKTDPAQINQFPRNGETVVPVNIKYAECEIAYRIIDNESTSSVVDDPLEELKAGPVTLKFKVGNGGGNALINDVVKSLLAPYGVLTVNGGTSRMIELIRG